uniref:Protein aurora borealis n=1 Tax=Strigamia maritima TaxID=126957 RepID=T1IH25_STRMM
MKTTTKDCGMGSAMKTAVCQGIPGLGMSKRDAEMCSNKNNNVKTKDEMTPLKGILSNPFEIGLHERLQQPSFSPSCFNHVLTEDGVEGPFRWSIDQMANLHPAEIDDVTCLQQREPLRIDSEYEEKAQEAINSFFSQNFIVPSPWLDDSRPVLRKTSCASSEGCCYGLLDFERFLVDFGKLFLLKPTPPKISQDASTQTILTLPINFDLHKHLGEYFTHLEVSVQPEEDNSLIASTLRRKLFTQDDSPFENQSSNSSAHFSSSPVPATGDLKRTSISPLRPIMSPIISPIQSSGGYDLNTSHDSSKCESAESMFMSFVCQNAALEIDSQDSRKDFKTNDPTQNSNQDTGYQTYDTDPIKTPKNELRMSWTPTTSSTPTTTKAQYSQLGMSIDE